MNKSFLTILAWRSWRVVDRPIGFTCSHLVTAQHTQLGLAADREPVPKVQCRRQEYRRRWVALTADRVRHPPTSPATKPRPASRRSSARPCRHRERGPGDRPCRDRNGSVVVIAILDPQAIQREVSNKVIRSISETPSLLLETDSDGASKPTLLLS
jgi:hypothetical protein